MQVLSLHCSLQTSFSVRQKSVHKTVQSIVCIGTWVWTAEHSIHHQAPLPWGFEYGCVQVGPIVSGLDGAECYVEERCWNWSLDSILCSLTLWDFLPQIIYKEKDPRIKLSFSTWFWCCILHRQWRMNPRRVEMGDMMQRTWARLTYQERHPYEKAAANDALRAQKEQRIYQEYERRYNELTFAAQQDGNLPLQYTSSMLASVSFATHQAFSNHKLISSILMWVTTIFVASRIACHMHQSSISKSWLMSPCTLVLE